MNTYLVCCALIINIFPLETEGNRSSQYRLLFGNFFAKDRKDNGILCLEDIEAYHIKDVEQWNKPHDVLDKQANLGLFGNPYFLNSVIAVAVNVTAMINNEIEHTDILKKGYSDLGRVFETGFNTTNNLLVHQEINARDDAIAYKLNTLQEFNRWLENSIDDTEDCGVSELVKGIFIGIIFHKSKGARMELTLSEFLSIMKQTPTNKESGENSGNENERRKKILPFLIQTAFKEYMLGMIDMRSTRTITQTGFEGFLRTHCEMKEDLSANFSDFVKDMGSTTHSEVQVSTLREKWASMSVVSAFNTLVKP